MTPAEELTRAGLIETRPGVFEKVNNYATRTISEAAAVGVGTDRHSGAAVEEAQDASEVSELPHSIEEEQQNDADDTAWEAPEEADDNNEAGVSGMDREGRSTFRITVALRVSNYGRRDPTGAIETICDLITATRRRLSERLAARRLDSDFGAPRPRRRSNHNRTAVKFKPTLPPPF